MQKRYLPPTRRSILQEGDVKYFGPHQRIKCSGSVHAFQTNSRGASKTRVMTSSRSGDFAEGSFFLAAMVFLLGFRLSVLRLAFLQLAQILVQTVETLLPVAAIAPHPVGDLLERPRRDPAGPPLGVAPPLNQSRLLQHLEVLRDGGKTHLERLGQLPDRRLAFGQTLQDRAPSRIGDGGQCDT